MFRMRIFIYVLVPVVAVLAFLPAVCDAKKVGKTIKLPKPSKKGTASLEELLGKRRSLRSYEPDALTEKQLAQLCWAAQGISEKSRGLRTAPSAGALYPLELHVVTKEGRFRYNPKKNTLKKEQAGDLRDTLKKSALMQSAIGEAPCVFVFSAVQSRTSVKYGKRASRYVLIEVGHAAQNLLLQATSLGLGGVTIGAFYDDKVKQALELREEEEPIYIIPVGKPKKD